MSKALHLKTNGEITVVDIPTEDGHIFINHKIGGWFDVVRLRDTNLHAYVHDTGLIDNLPINNAVSMLFDQLLCGDIVLSSIGDNGEEVDIDGIYRKLDFLVECSRLNTDDKMSERLEKMIDRNPTYTITVG